MSNVISEEHLVALAGFGPMTNGIIFEEIDGPNCGGVFVGDEHGSVCVPHSAVREMARELLGFRAARGDRA